MLHWRQPAHAALHGGAVLSSREYFYFFLQPARSVYTQFVVFLQIFVGPYRLLHLSSPLDPGVPGGPTTPSAD